MTGMKSKQPSHFRLHMLALAILTSISSTNAASVKDIFGLNPDGSSRSPRDSKYFLDRGLADGQRDLPNSRSLKPEDLPEARESQANTGIEKRCSRCDYYTDYRGSGGGGGGGGGSGGSSYRSDYRYQDPRYDSRRNYDDRYDSYDRYDNYDQYYDPYYERDRYRRPSYGGRDDYDRYEPRDRYNSGGYRDRNYDYTRQYDRGVGYDNIGYDYRGYEGGSGGGGGSRSTGYRPYDETYRGSSGWDNSGRGYYFNRGGVPENAGKWGTYASGWGYGRDDRDRGYRDYGPSRGQSRPRDYFSYGTSYLYGRPSSSTTTSNPSNSPDGDNSVTDSPNDSPSSG